MRSFIFILVGILMWQPNAQGAQMEKNQKIEIFNARTHQVQKVDRVVKSDA